MEEELSELRAQVQALTATVRRLTPRETGWIPPTATVGERVKLAGNVALISRKEAPVVIGAGTNIYRNAEILGPVIIGARCLINRDSYIRPNTTIEDDVYIGPFVRIITDGHEIGPETRRAGTNKVLPVRIGAGAWIGASSTILGGVNIGRGAIVAAGSLVNKNVADNTLVGGVPARIIRTLVDDIDPAFLESKSGSSGTHETVDA